MPPLLVEGGPTYQDNHQFNQTQLSELLGVSPATLKIAAIQVGVAITPGKKLPSSDHENLYLVGDIPKIIERLQIRHRASYSLQSYNDYLMDADTTAPEFTLKPPGKPKLTFTQG